MTDKQHYTIRIEEGNEHHSSTMDIYDEDAFFYSSYQQAAATVTKIVKLSNDFLAERACSTKPCGASYAEYHNNIVAFCADRGQGKTSAMLSMAEALRKIVNSDDHRVVDFWNHPSVMLSAHGVINPVLKTRFEVLETIDPTCMTEKDSILRIIITKMYKSASDMWKRYIMNHRDEYDADNKQSVKERFAEKFLACYKGVEFLYKTETDINSYFDDLNLLSEYGDSNHFRINFSELVELYLQFTAMLRGSYGEKTNSMLVIKIDDPDLNTKNAFTIAEEIRKYLMLPRVLVLMAAHIGDLARSIEQYYLKEYKTIIQLETDSDIKDHCHVAMERYIEKWIPSSHRVNLTYIAQFLRDDYSKIKLSYIGKNGEELLRFYETDEKNIEMTYQNQLILLIYYKTGIILCKPDYYLHDFLPNNMRELNHFLYMLNTMENVIRKDGHGKNVGTYQSILEMFSDYSVNKSNSVYRQRFLDEIGLHLKNLSIFSDYLRNAWCPKRLTNAQLKKVLNLHKISHVMINLRTGDLLKEYIFKLFGVGPRDTGLDLKYGDLRSREQPNITGKYTPLSDIHYALYQLRHQDNPQKYFYLICAIRIYYSIYLHKVALSEIKRWADLTERPESRRGTPFEDLVRLTGSRIFPILYYRIKGLPMIIFQFKHNKPRASSEKNGGKNEYTVFQYFTCPCDSISSLAKNPKGKEKGQKLSVDGFYFPGMPYFLFHHDMMSGSQEYFIFNSKYQYFDIFRPLTAILKYSKYNDVEAMSGSEAKILDAVLTLVCNTELQELLYQKFFKDTFKLSKPKEDHYSPPEERVYDYILGMYRMMDNVIKDGTIMSIGSSLYSAMFDSFDPSQFIGFTRCDGKNGMIDIYVPSDKYRIYDIMTPDFSLPEIKKDQIELIEFDLESGKKVPKPEIPMESLEHLQDVDSSQANSETES